MYSCQLLGQLYLVCQLADPLTNPIRSHVPGGQLPFHMKSDSASEWGDFEIDIVPNLKLEVSPTVIYVALLLALGNPQVLSHLGDSFFGIFDLCGAKE